MGCIIKRNVQKYCDICNVTVYRVKQTPEFVLHYYYVTYTPMNPVFNNNGSIIVFRFAKYNLNFIFIGPLNLNEKIITSKR